MPDIPKSERALKEAQNLKAEEEGKGKDKEAEV